MSVKSDYQKNRKDSTELNHKLISRKDPPFIIESADFLGALYKSDSDNLCFEFEDQYHMDLIMDLAIHNIEIDVQTFIEWAEKNLELTPRYKEILNIYKKASLELYQVISVESNKFRVNLKNIMSEENISFVDLSMSTCYEMKGKLIYVRILDFSLQKMTSGMAMSFHEEDYDIVMEAYSLDISADSISKQKAERFKRMHSLYKELGIQVES